MPARLLTFSVWCLVAASALFWGLRLFVHGQPLPAQVRTPGRSVAVGGDLQRLLGVAAADSTDPDEEAPAEGSDRFRLLGVVAPRGAEHSPQGVALIAVGDQPAKAWRTGAVVDGDLVLLGVTRRGAMLGPRGGPATTELTLPEPTPSAAPGLPARAPGVVPGRGFGGVPGAAQVAPGMAVRPAGQVAQPAGRAPNGQADEPEDEE